MQNDAKTQNPKFKAQKIMKLLHFETFFGFCALNFVLL